MEENLSKISKNLDSMTLLLQRPDIIPSPNFETLPSIISEDLLSCASSKEALQSENESLRSLLHEAEFSYKKTIDRIQLENETLRENYIQLSKTYKEQKRVFTSEIQELNERYDQLKEEKEKVSVLLKSTESKLSTAITQKVYYEEKLSEEKKLPKCRFFESGKQSGVLEMKIKELELQLESLHKLYIQQVEENERLARSTEDSFKTVEEEEQDNTYVDKKL